LGFFFFFFFLKKLLKLFVFFLFQDHNSLHTPYADQVVGITSKEGLSVSAPCQRNTLRILGQPWRMVQEEVWNSLVQLSNNSLGVQVPNFNGWAGTSTQPITVGGKDESIDDIPSLERTQMFPLIQIPQHCSPILTTRSTQSAVRRDGDRVDVSCVTRKVGNQLAVLKVPHLNQFIPSSRDNQRFGAKFTNGSNIGGESDTAHPLSVTIVLNGVLTNSKSISQLNGLITRSRYNLTVVSWESDTQDILLVANELAMTSSCVDVPQAESPIPRTR